MPAMHPDVTRTNTYSDQSVPGLELQRILAIVNQGESGGLSSSELGPESEDDDLVFGGLVHAGQLLPELILGYIGSGRVENVHDHLLTLEQTVREELSCTDGDCAGRILQSRNRKSKKGKWS